MSRFPGIDEASGTIERDSVSSRREQQISLDETLLVLNRVAHAAVTSIVVAAPHLLDIPMVLENTAIECISGYTLPADRAQDLLTAAGEASMNAIRHARGGG